MIKLEDKLYTSTEVAQILGVSLRSVYRYIEESKLKAEVKTATGRHRFTKQDILEFLYPEGQKKPEDAKKEAPKEDIQQKEKILEKPEEEAVPENTEEKESWLDKFRTAAKQMEVEKEAGDIISDEPKEEVTIPERVETPVEDEPEVKKPESEPSAKPVEEVSQVATDLTAETSVQDVSQKDEKQPAAPKSHHYRSSLGGLKDIAQSIDKNSRESNFDYAFTLNAGLSLHAPIKPFALLHAYVRLDDLTYFEKLLQLIPSDEEGAQLCLLTSDDSSLYSNREELHGLYVVSKGKLKRDVAKFGDDSTKEEATPILG